MRKLRGNLKVACLLITFFGFQRHFNCCLLEETCLQFVLLQKFRLVYDVWHNVTQVLHRNTLILKMNTFIYVSQFWCSIQMVNR